LQLVVATEEGKTELGKGDQRVHGEDQSVFVESIAQMGQVKAAQTVEEQVG
jgi:hypothetical protein